MVCPTVTWPSPPMTTVPPLRTVRMVVPCQEGISEDAMRVNLLKAVIYARRNPNANGGGAPVANPANP